MNKFLKRRAFGTTNPAGALIGGEGSAGNRSAGDGVITFCRIPTERRSGK
jgi:hypothetical protein